MQRAQSQRATAMGVFFVSRLFMVHAPHHGSRIEASANSAAHFAPLGSEMTRIASLLFTSVGERHSLQLSCDVVDSACDGGLMDDGFAFAKKNAMCTEDSHSHTGAKDTSSTSSCTVGAQESVTGCKDMTVNSVETLMTTLTEQPLISRY